LGFECQIAILDYGSLLPFFFVLVISVPGATSHQSKTDLLRIAGYEIFVRTDYEAFLEERNKTAATCRSPQDWDKNLM